MKNFLFCFIFIFRENRTIIICAQNIDSSKSRFDVKCAILRTLLNYLHDHTPSSHVSIQEPLHTSLYTEQVLTYSSVQITLDYSVSNTKSDISRLVTIETSLYPSLGSAVKTRELDRCTQNSSPGEGTGITS